MVYRRNGLFTSESVAAGHPDKLCDRISDSILDAVLALDPYARVAVEAAIKGHDLFIFGEVSANSVPDFQAIALQVLRDTGHGSGAWGLDLRKLQIRQSISVQSPEIGGAVGGIDDPGAGDQGMMFGYASNETPEFMPLTIALANRLITRQEVARRANNLLGPDAKSQVTVRYKDGVPEYVETIVLSTQHSPDITLEDLRGLVRAEIIEPAIGALVSPNTRVLINPAGTFHVGGPVADAGLTGRKIIVDTYGGMAPHGGGAFSGKDPTKVDRSGAYAARQLAREVVARGWAPECEVRIAYAIGEAAPVAVDIDAHGFNAVDRFEHEGFDLRGLLRPGSIIQRLDLRRPIYAQTAFGGHFGRDQFPWEAPLAQLPANTSHL